MSDARLLRPDELKRAGGFWVEARTAGMHVFLLGVHIADRIDGDVVHMTCSVGKVVGNISNYNIGWRAWLMKPTDDQRKAEPWNPVVPCNGVGYGWDCDFCDKGGCSKDGRC